MIKACVSLWGQAAAGPHFDLYIYFLQRWFSDAHLAHNSIHTTLQGYIYIPKHELQRSALWKSACTPAILE